MSNALSNIAISASASLVLIAFARMTLSLRYRQNI